MRQEVKDRKPPALQTDGPHLKKKDRDIIQGTEGKVNTNRQTVDRWQDAWQATEEDGFSVEEAMTAIGVKRRQYFNLKKLWKEMPNEIKEKVQPDALSEKHCIQLLDLSISVALSDWLTTEHLWIDLANIAIEKKLSVAKLKASNKAWNKEHSFRKLCEHPELRMPKTSLHRCVQLVIQDKLFLTVQAPGQSLPKSHKQLLLPVPPEGQKGSRKIQ